MYRTKKAFILAMVGLHLGARWMLHRVRYSIHGDYPPEVFDHVVSERLGGMVFWSLLGLLVLTAVLAVTTVYLALRAWSIRVNSESA